MSYPPVVEAFVFCPPCGALISIFRQREGLEGTLRALRQIAGSCPQCGPQISWPIRLVDDQEGSS